MTEPNEIVTVHLGSGILDNDYTLYDDGRVKRFYDYNMYSLNHEDWSNAEKLSEDIKQEFLAKCADETLKEKAKKLLYPNN